MRLIVDQSTVSNMASTEEINYRMEKLSSDNYYNWKFDMRMLLIGKDLWDIVSGAEVVANDASPAQKDSFRKRDQKAMSQICLGVMPDVKIYVRSAKTSKEAWDALSNHYEEKTLSKQINAKKQLFNLKLEPGGNMVQHVNRMKTLSDQMQALGDPVSDRDLVMLLFVSLPNSYNTLVTTLETLTDEKLTWEYVRDRAITEYERRKSSGPKGPDEALYVGGGQGNGGRNS